MATENNATGESLRAPFSREVLLLDQAAFLNGQRVEILRGTEVYKADAMKYSEKRSSEICDHPIENGTPVTDHKIIQPREFTLTVALPALYGGMVLRTLERYFLNSDKIIVKCATGVYRNMILTDKPTNITPNDLERPMYDLELKEVFIVSPEITEVKQAMNPLLVTDRDTLRTTAVPRTMDEQTEQNVKVAIA